VQSLAVSGLEFTTLSHRHRQLHCLHVARTYPIVDEHWQSDSQFGDKQPGYTVTAQ